MSFRRLKNCWFSGISRISGVVSMAIVLIVAASTAEAQSYAGSTSPGVSNYGAETTNPVSSTRTISRRTYTRRVNADGTVTEVPATGQTTSVSRGYTTTRPAGPQVSVSETKPTQSTSYMSPASPTSVTRPPAVTSSPVNGTRYQAATSSESQRSYSATSSYVPSDTQPVRRVTRTYTRTEQAPSGSTIRSEPIGRASPVSTQKPLVSTPVVRSQLASRTRYAAPPTSSGASTQSVMPSSAIIASNPVAPSQSPVTRYKPDPVKKDLPETSQPASTVRTVSVTQTDNSEELVVQKLPADEVPNIETIHQILWSTLVGISQAQNSGDYSDFRKILSPRMKAEYSATQLPVAFQGMERERPYIAKAVGAPALFELQPYLTKSGRMRLRGAFPTAKDEALRFDMIYTNLDGVWYVDAVALALG